MAASRARSRDAAQPLLPPRLSPLGSARLLLARIAPQLGYDGDPRQLLAWVRTNPKFLPFRSEAQILERYAEINRTVAAALPRLFGRSPKAPLEIKPEPELTKASASDHYNVPAEDGSRPGTFWAVINESPLQQPGQQP